ncbi:hypothetical protein JCM33374_g6677 [Metschnikowia sp. JCM 33374]|nr:hypothetical protein JCM33374_g6677 [Metschnikowia sp. JCM 33374]
MLHRRIAPSTWFHCLKDDLIVRGTGKKKRPGLREINDWDKFLGIQLLQQGLKRWMTSRREEANKNRPYENVGSFDKHVRSTNRSNHRMD